MRIVIVPSGFKECLDAEEVAAAALKHERPCAFLDQDR